jgi:microcystin-dependent protein
LSGTISSTNIGNDSVALGTKTTGDYVQTLSAGTGVTVTGGTGEGSTPTVAIGQAVGTTSSPQFAGITATGTVSANALSSTTSVSAASASITGTTATSVLTVDSIEIDTTGATANQVLKYNGTKFAPSTGASVTISDTAPTSPTPQAGDQWYESDTGRQFIYYDSVWVEIANSNDVGQTPPGVISQYAGSSAPTGWLICDGTAVSRSTYASLFSVIGTTYGSGDGSTTFALPNLKGRVPVGLDSTDTSFDALGETGGAKTHTLTASESGVASHSHGITDPSHKHQQSLSFGNGGATNGGPYYFSAGTTLQNIIETASQTTGITVNNATATSASSAHNNLQPYIVVNYIIKA